MTTEIINDYFIYWNMFSHLLKDSDFKKQTEIYPKDIKPFYFHRGNEFQYPVFTSRETQKIYLFPNYGELIPEVRDRVAIYRGWKKSCRGTFFDEYLRIF